MKKKSGVKLGLIAGLLIGILYMGLLMIRYTYFSYDPFVSTLSSFISFILLIIFLLLLANLRKRYLGGFANIKELFQPIFVSILVIEVICYLFNYYYLNHINPKFFILFEQGTRDFAPNSKLPKEQLALQIASIREASKDSLLFWKPMFGIVRWIIVDSIFGFIIAFVLRTRVSSEQIKIWRERDIQK